MKKRILVELVFPLCLLAAIWIATIATQSAMNLAIIFTGACAAVFACAIGRKLIRR
jgi:hypothetical protein